MDIVERLKKRKEIIIAANPNGVITQIDRDAIDAVDEIERLREALRTIAMSHLEHPDRNSGWGFCILTANAALQQKDSE